MDDNFTSPQLPQIGSHSGPERMMRLEMMIDELSKRADESELIALLATSRPARLYNADLARELRDVVEALTKELDRRRGSTLCQSRQRIVQLLAEEQAKLAALPSAKDAESTVAIKL